MKKILQISILVLIAITYLMIGLSYADTHTADSCSLAHINTAITAAARGDTVSVPAGECTWTAPLSITKGITLQGAGSTNTIITLNYNTSVQKYAEPCHTPFNGTGLRYTMINFRSDNIALDENETVRITGFRFNANTALASSTVGFIGIINDQTTALRKVIIDNNIFYGDPTKTYWPLVLQGRIYGVYHSNTVDMGYPFFDIRGMSVCDLWWGEYEWASLTYTPGTKDTFFIEDNTINKRAKNAYPPNELALAGRLTVRYNTTNVYGTEQEYYNGWQSHGYYNTGGSPQYPPQALEVYGNYTYAQNQTSATFSPILSLCRAGQCLSWNNLFNSNTGTVSAKGEYQHECNAALMGDVTGHVCGSDTMYSGEEVCDSSGLPFHVFRSYQFQNRQGAAGTTLVTSIQRIVGTGYSDPAYVCGGAANEATVSIRLNQDLWGDNTSCTGTSCLTGVGCGATLPTCANPANCPTGVGFWLTDQSCAELTTDNTGAGGTPATKKRTGTLYRRVNNAWVPYYTPAPYPHELRADVPADTTAPAISNLSPTAEQPCDDVDETEDIALSLTAQDQTQASVTCYYDTETRADYAALAADGHEMTASGTTFSATESGLACASIHTIWYACSDGTTATSVGTYQFVVAGKDDLAAATITSVTTANQACSSMQKISISTDKPSTCKWSLTDEAYADMDYTFSVTGGETGHIAHSTDVTQSCSETVTRYIRCSTTNGVANSSSVSVSITTDAAKSVAIGTGSLSVTVGGTGSNTITVIP